MDTRAYLSEYLSWGWKLFPCHAIVDGRCTCGQRDCSSPGKHPRTRNGVRDASKDPAVIHKWWSNWPEANIGLACGAESNVVVIDIDGRHNPALDDYEAGRPGGPLPATLKAKTGGGGQHLFFTYPTQPVPNRVRWLEGVDVRSDGGYVILAPGSHISGSQYTWVDPQQPMEPLPLDTASDIAKARSGTSGDFNLADSEWILNGVPEGQRDDALFRWACRLRRKHSTDEDGGRAIVTFLVLAAAEKANFPRDEALLKVEQAFKQDHSDGGYSTVDEPLTDVGNRNRFLALHGDDLLYVPEVGWMGWTGKGWLSRQTEFVLNLAEDVSNLLVDEAGTIQDDNIRAAWEKHARKAQGWTAIRNVEAMARHAPGVLRSMDDFDQCLTDLACDNGIVDLKTGAIRPYSRSELVTRNTGVQYDPGARSQLWEDFLEESTQGDKELQEYLQLAAGYTATGLNTEECFFVITGPPASGKSTYVDGIMNALGSYAVTTQSDTFMYRRNQGSPETELARLAGVRKVSISEIRENDAFDEALVKQVTGGDRITARELYKKQFNYVPQFKIWIATNHDPASMDMAMLRRIKRIQFDHTVPREKRDPRLKMAIRTTERSAILTWIVEGAMKYLEFGKLKEPAAVTAAVQDYQASQDVFGMFVAECLRMQEGHTSYLTEVYAHWRIWAQEHGHPPGRIAPFRARLKERGLVSGLTDEGREYFPNLSLIVSLV